MKNTKIFLIGALIIVILAMIVGYSAFATQTNLNATAEIIGEWDVRIINIEAKDISEDCDPGKPRYTNTSVTFDAKLAKPGDSITYIITIENAGTIDAILNDIIFMEETNGSEAINYKTSEIDHSLKAGEQTTLTVKAMYDPKSTEVPSVKTKTIIGIIEYVQNST